MIFLSIQNIATNLLCFVFWIQEAKEAWSAYGQHNKAGGSIDASKPDKRNAYFFHKDPGRELFDFETFPCLPNTLLWEGPPGDDRDFL